MNEGEGPNADREERPAEPSETSKEQQPGHEGTSSRREKQAGRGRRQGERSGEVTAEAPAAKRPKRRLRRWTLRSLLGLLVLLGLGVLALHIILQTTLPRELVIERLQREFGLRISAESLEAGWRGHTDLKNVKLALPLADEAFFEVPRMRVEHTNVLAMVLGFKVKIEAVTLESPRLVVRQDALGRWDVAEALALVTRAGGDAAPPSRRRARHRARRGFSCRASRSGRRRSCSWTTRGGRRRCRRWISQEFRRARCPGRSRCSRTSGCGSRGGWRQAGGGSTSCRWSGWGRESCCGRGWTCRSR